MGDSVASAVAATPTIAVRRTVVSALATMAATPKEAVTTILGEPVASTPATAPSTTSGTSRSPSWSECRLPISGPPGREVGSLDVEAHSEPSREPGCTNEHRDACGRREPPEVTFLPACLSPPWTHERLADRPAAWLPGAPARRG